VDMITSQVRGLKLFDKNFVCQGLVP
jgi:hypothetical protein